MDKGFKYEVAISFLSSDEMIAQQIADELSDRLEVFIFPEKQKILVGSDGVEKFISVFKNEARLNVIIFRKGWGDTQWTKVEENGIKASVQKPVKVTTPYRSNLTRVADFD
jgi:hypothetical protein